MGLGWKSAVEKFGIGRFGIRNQWELGWKEKCVILVVRVIGKIGQMNRWFLGTTVLEDNRQDIET